MATKLSTWRSQRGDETTEVMQPHKEALDLPAPTRVADTGHLAWDDDGRCERIAVAVRPAWFF
jgi:hypothetical protein